MTTQMVTWLADALRAAGLPVREVPGWKTRGHGEMSSQILGVICHHTAGPKTGSYPSESVVVNGRPGLAGPLANLGLARDGTWVVIAAGSAWHAGTGEISWCPANTGNTHCLGVEAESCGTVDDWTDAQRGSYPRGAAALLAHLGLPASRAIAHREWAPGRKVDPSFWDMDTFRSDVDRWLRVAGKSAQPSSPRITLMEDDMTELAPAPTGRSQTLVVPTGAAELVISLGWMSMRIDSVAFFGSTPATGVAQLWRSSKAQVVDAARPWRIPVPAGAITAEVNYVLPAHPGIEVHGVAAFRS